MAGLDVASYTVRDGTRQPQRPQGRPAFAAILGLAALGLAGCSTIMIPLSGWGSAEGGPPPGEITTGSVPKPTVAAPQPDSDGEVIRRTVEAAVHDRTTGRVEWRNASSGNSGTITDLVEAKASNGAPCRDFATTLTTIDGVRMYRGRACQGYTGPWDLVEFGPASVEPAG